MKLATKPLVAVIWHDAHGVATGDYSETEVERDFHKAARYTTFGLLVRDTDIGVSLASDTGEDDKYRGMAFIPRGMIIEIINLGIPQKRRARGTTGRGNRRHSRNLPARAPELPADDGQGDRAAQQQES